MNLKRGRSSSVRARERSAIVLLAADGLQNKEIAARLGEDVMKVGRWRHRYAQAGLPGILKDKSRPGRIPPIAASVRSRIVEMTLHETPVGNTHWSRTTMSKASGVSASTVGRICVPFRDNRVETGVFDCTIKSGDMERGTMGV